MKKVYILQNLGCANCAAKIEQKINRLPGVEEATITYATKQLRITAEDPDALIPEIQKIANSVEPEIVITSRDQAEHEEHHHHEHHHHHDDDDCCCGHDHDHHHHHDDDDDDCCCGHDHHHHHDDDDDDCCCGHEHHHHDHEDHREPAHEPDTRGKTVYILENLGCANCAAKMEGKIRELPGVKSAAIVFATRKLILDAKNPEALLPKIREICTAIESEVKVVPAESHKPEKKAEAGHGKELAEIVCGAVLFVAGIVLGKMDISVLGIPACLPVFILAYLVLAKDILITAVKNIGHGQIFDENFLMSIASLGAFGIAEYDEAVGVILFYRIGEFFEHVAVERSRSQIMEAVDMRPEVVTRIRNQRSETIPAGDAKVGDLILIRPGDRIPLDGVIVSGESRIDTSPVTGESVPVHAGEGDHVTSGCVNTSGQLTVRVEKVLAESMVTRILDSVENAAASKPKVDRFITRFAQIYTPVVVALAIGTAVIPSIITGNWRYWIYTACSFLVMSCPCALVLSVPLAFFSGIGAGSKKGILFKGGVSIEAMGGIKAVVMDKTGTITKGNFVLQQAVAADGRNDELLRVAACVERNSTHPIAVSIVSAAKEKGIALEACTGLQEIAGHGLAAVLDGRQILCGNRKLMAKYGVDTSAYSGSGYGAEVLVAADGQYLGHLVIADTLKPEAKAAIATLRKQKIATAMLTGDTEESAKAVAAEAGIDEVHAKLLPQDKVTKLSAIRKQYGPVMFVGDGINDAPVLAGADVGAAMGSGADAAIEAADVVYMTSSVEAIPESLEIAHRTKAIAWQNVVFALAVKIAVMALGLMGFASMWAAVFADTGVAMLCVINSIRILYRKK